MRKVKINYVKDGYQAVGDYKTIKKMIVLASEIGHRWFATFPSDNKNCELKVKTK